jgi:hypothetical protein
MLRTRSRRDRGDRGASTPELVLVIPAMFLVIAFAFQLIFWALASHAVLASASDGGDVARALGSTPAAGVAAARAANGAIAAGLVVDPSFSAFEIAGGNEVLRVQGTVTEVFPGLRLEVGATSIGPLDQFRGSG